MSVGLTVCASTDISGRSGVDDAIAAPADAGRRGRVLVFRGIASGVGRVPQAVRPRFYFDRLIPANRRLCRPSPSNVT